MNEIPITTDDIFTPDVIKTESETPPFEFKSPLLVAQPVFNIWLEENLGQRVVFVEPDEIARKKAKEPNQIFIPKNLKLEDLPQVLEAIPEISEKQKEQLQEHLSELGHMFINSARYIYEYMFRHDYPVSSSRLESDIQEENTKAHEIARQTVRYFYLYGQRLIGEPVTTKGKVLETLHNKTLSEEEKEQVEQWLLGTDAYKRRKQRTETLSEEKREQRRIETTWHYFKALARARTEKEGPFKDLSTKTRENVRKAINKPERDLYKAIFDEGVSIEKIQEAIRNFIESYLQEIFKNSDITEKAREISIERYDPFRSKKIQQLQEQFEQERNSEKKNEIKKKLITAIAETLQNFRLPMKDNEKRSPYLILKTRRANCLMFSILLHKTLEYFKIEHRFAIQKSQVNTPELKSRHAGIIVEIGEETLFIDQNEIRSIQSPNTISQRHDITRVQFKNPEDIKHFGIDHLLTTDNPDHYIQTLLSELAYGGWKFYHYPYYLHSLAEPFFSDADLLQSKAETLLALSNNDLYISNDQQTLEQRALERQALKLLDKAQELDPLEPLVYNTRLDILLKQQKFQEALQQIRQLSKLFVHPEVFLKQVNKYLSNREETDLSIEELEILEASLLNYIEQLGDLITPENLRRLRQKRDGLEHLKRHLEK